MKIWLTKCSPKSQPNRHFYQHFFENGVKNPSKHHKNHVRNVVNLVWNLYYLSGVILCLFRDFNVRLIKNEMMYEGGGDNSLDGHNSLGTPSFNDNLVEQLFGCI